jgi:hypothetical protein
MGALQLRSCSVLMLILACMVLAHGKPPPHSPTNMMRRSDGERVRISLAGQESWDRLGSKPYLRVASGPRKGQCVSLLRPVTGGSSANLGLYPCSFPAASTAAACPTCALPWTLGDRGQLVWKGNGGCLTLVKRDPHPADTQATLVVMGCNSTYPYPATWSWKNGTLINTITPNFPVDYCIGVSNDKATADRLTITTCSRSQANTNALQFELTAAAAPAAASAPKPLPTPANGEWLCSARQRPDPCCTCMVCAHQTHVLLHPYGAYEIRLSLHLCPLSLIISVCLPCRLGRIPSCDERRTYQADQTTWWMGTLTANVCGMTKRYYRKEKEQEQIHVS